jgi:CRP/FNR family cyclic AMP-dependent transcriptional regulator
MQADEKQFAALIKLFESGTKLTYRKGEYIIRPGEAPGHVFYIQTGLIKAFNISKYGEENLLIIRKGNEIFPLIWALTGQEREIIYQAMTPSVLWRTTREDYLAFLHSHPSAMEPILDMVTEMYRIHSERILNLEYRSVRERLVSFLVTMANRFGKETDKGILIEVPLKHQDIASSINASRETASRQLSVLESKGLISNKRSFITIIDNDAMLKYLD